MRPTQSLTLSREENRPVDDSPEGVVIPFPGTNADDASQPETGGQQTGDGTPVPAVAIEEVCAHIADLQQRIGALTERWHGLEEGYAHIVDLQQRIRELTSGWKTSKPARAQIA